MSEPVASRDRAPREEAEALVDLVAQAHGDLEQEGETLSAVGAVLRTAYERGRARGERDAKAVAVPLLRDARLAIELEANALTSFTRQRDAARAEALEKAAAHFDATELRSAEAHAVYQEEAHRRGDVRHPDAYADLSEETKEWDRVLVRWIARSLRALARGEGE